MPLKHISSQYEYLCSCEVQYTCSMNVLITAKLKLHTDAAQFQALRATSLAYRDALNHVSQYSFAHGNKGRRQLQ